ncbi:hypothetical protein Tco_0399728 [Tanacetum coccineum]
MAEENVPAPSPKRSDKHILPFNAWLPVGKGNLLLDLQKLQKNPIFRISVDILQNTNFFRAFTASANVPTIYIQQFWNTLVQDAKTEVYSFQLDEQWFTLNADLLRKALEITPVDSAHLFVSPPAGDQVMDFVNELGYPEEIHFVSKMYVNNLYQPWRAILSLINQCLTDKTSGSDKPQHPILQMLWGIVTRSNVDYAELLWEEFVQAIQIFFAHRANLNIPTKKPTPHVILYCRFTKLIIYYLGSEHNIHRRPGSPVHVTGDDFLLGNIKFVPKGEKDEVFGKPIPQDRKEKRYDLLVDEEDEEPQVEDDEYNLQRGITQRLPVVEGKGKGIATDEQVAQSLLELQKPKKQSTTDQYIFQSRIPATQDAPTGPSAQPQDDTSANVVRDTPSPADVETGADTKKSNSEGDTEILNVDEEREHVLMEEDQAGSNPGQSHVVLAGPNPEPMHEEFVDTVYPQVHESSKHTIEEHVHIENPLSSSGTLSSMKNLDDACTFGDQFLNDKPTKEEPGKANVETEVESMVTVPFHQASSSAPPLSTPIIDLTPPKPVSPPAQEPVFTATTTTTPLLSPPPPPQQSTTDPVLAARVSALEQICANFEKKHKLHDKTTQALSSRVFTLENHDLYSKIDNYVNETVKEAIHNALQVPIRDHFRELS